MLSSLHGVLDDRTWVLLQVFEYFRVFADEFDLRRHIRLRTAVLSAEYDASAAHLSGADAEIVTAAAEAKCNGSSSAPWRLTSAPVCADGSPPQVRPMQRSTLTSDLPDVLCKAAGSDSMMQLNVTVDVGGRRLMCRPSTSTR